MDRFFSLRMFLYLLFLSTEPKYKQNLKPLVIGLHSRTVGERGGGGRICIVTKEILVLIEEQKHSSAFILFFWSRLSHSRPCW